MRIRKFILLVIGFICLCIGSVGVVLPFLPSVPFFLVTAFCFAKSSQKLHRWFTGTGLYKRHLESYVQKRGMAVKTKAMVIVSITLVMGTGFAFMGSVPAARAVLGIVWAAHLIYFTFGVKTFTGTP